MMTISQPHLEKPFACLVALQPATTQFAQTLRSQRYSRTDLPPHRSGNQKTASHPTCNANHLAQPTALPVSAAARSRPNPHS
jgi:hypothetical protein